MLPLVPRLIPAQLPPPRAGQSGWPWLSAPVRTDQDAQATAWPRITVVTPSFEQGRFLEESIRSVLLQGYPALEYIVLDGGSRDESVDIIRRYAEWLSSHRSSPDSGQAAAVQEGWELGTGDIVAFLNADDVYLPGTLFTVARQFSAAPDALAICGRQLRIIADGRIRGSEPAHNGSWNDLLQVKSPPQPSVFLRRSAFEAVGGIQTRYPLIFDFDLWIRVSSRGPIAPIPDILAATREHAGRISERRRTDIASELERYAVDLQAAQALPMDSRDRARFIAKLNYVIASIYADAPVRHLRPLLAAATRALAANPAIAAEFFRAFFRRGVRLSKAARPDQIAGMPLSTWATETSATPAVPLL